MSNTTYDAIVIGSGISGGWAAKELCERGLKTLLLERGRDVKHGDYPTAMLKPWEFKDRLLFTQKDLEDQHIQYLECDTSNKHFFVNDKEHPYIQDRPFSWIRGYQVGGRSLVWGRQSYRLSDLDFEANLHDGHGVDWPIRYQDIAPWYSYVEKFIGVSGQKDGLSYLPDGEFLPPMELNCIEEHFAKSIKSNNNDRLLTISRIANLTQPLSGTRVQCQRRNLCARGCPYGAYFSSNSSTIPAALATGNLTLRPFSIVAEIIYDDATQRAKGVRVIDSETMKSYEFYSKIVFLNASTIASTSILLNSKSSRFPTGMGNDSGELGHNLMDHHSAAGAAGYHEEFKDKYYKGRRPSGFLIPRYRNLKNSEGLSFLRGYHIQGTGERKEWRDRIYDSNNYGIDFKNALTTPGNWGVWMAGWGECLPYHDNRMYLSHSDKDKWGQPLVHIDFEFKENEKKMMEDIRQTSSEMLANAGFKGISPFIYRKEGGRTVHEMGTARMGHDPQTSVLNKFNQIHSVKNVFVTDGSCMTSSACQNPSLTYMALTARACAYAVQQLQKGSL